jgi:hypothetical protein
MLFVLREQLWDQRGMNGAQNCLIPAYQVTLGLDDGF